MPLISPHAACTSTADEIANTRAMLMIEQTLRRTRRLHDAAMASLAAATKVQQVAERAHVDLPDDDVTRVARAAAQIARGMVVGVCARDLGVVDVVDVVAVATMAP